MDHYCPWVSNTIGFANHKFFLLTVFYTNIACLMLNIDVVGLLLTHSLPPAFSSILFCGSVLSFILNAFLAPLLAFHLYLLLGNVTTIEFCEYSRKQGQEGQRTPVSYNVGIFQNISSVMGANPLCWFLPVGNPGDGIDFDTADTGPNNQKACRTDGLDEAGNRGGGFCELIVDFLSYYFLPASTEHEKTIKLLVNGGASEDWTPAKGRNVGADFLSV